MILFLFLKRNIEVVKSAYRENIPIPHFDSNAVLKRSEYIFIGPTCILQVLLFQFTLQLALLVIFLWLVFALTIQNLEVNDVCLNIETQTIK